jgi:hypothetical protein
MRGDHERRAEDPRVGISRVQVRPGNATSRRAVRGSGAAAGAALLGPGAVMDLQRLAGNRAVTGIITAQRDPPAPAPPKADGLDAGAAMQLGMHDIQLSNDDENALAQSFPNGFALSYHPALVLTLQSGSTVDFVRIAAFEVVPPPSLQAGTESYIFKVGKGRSILVSSIGGRSIMLDAGSGTSLSPNGAGVQQLLNSVALVTGSVAAVPEAIRISHADSDHYNAVRPLLSTAGFAQTAVEVAAEQLRTAGNFSRATLTAQPGQRLITIDVVGAGGDVQMRRVVVDNMEITEFRSVPAHAAAAASQTGEYDRNRTSPVTIVMDLITGERYVYTADAPGRLLNEVVNSVGERAFQRLLGADARYLRVVELPHHGGEQTGPDAAGLLRFLRLAFESGSGDTRVVTQTSQSFAAKPSSAINFLDVAGVAPERVGADPSAPGTTEVVRARGSTMANVTIDTGGVTDVIQIVRANESSLHEAYRRLNQIASLRDEAGTMAEGLARSQAPEPLLASVRATHAGLVQQENTLRASADTVWGAMETAAAGTAGMRGTRDVTAVTAGLAALAQATAANDPTTAGNDLQAHERGLASYTRVYVNLVQMMSALDDGRFEDVHRLRAEQLGLLKGVRAVLGSAVVDEHVRAAWEATQNHWTTERINEAAETMASQLVYRRMSTEFRATLGETLARQLQLTEMVEKMVDSGPKLAYGPKGQITTPMSSRVVAGALAAVEVARLGLDLWENHKVSAAQDELRKAQGSREGIGALNWWMARGVLPEVALVDQSSWSGRYGIVSDGMSQESILAAVRSENPPAGTPSFDKVVVSGVDPGQLQRVVYAFMTAVPDLQSWNDLNLSYPAGAALKRFDAGWAVRLWSVEDKQYKYFEQPAITADMDALIAQLRASQQDRMSVETASRPYGSMRALKDSGWIRTRRIMWAYESGGAFTKINSKGFTPMFTHEKEEIPAKGDGKTHMLVRAADVPTLELLSQYWWVSRGPTSEWSWDIDPPKYTLAPNTKGLAYVDSEDLMTSEGSIAIETTAKMNNPNVKSQR